MPIDELHSPIPPGVYYSEEHSNFYDLHSVGMGTTFLETWSSRRAEFPQSKFELEVRPHVPPGVYFAADKNEFFHASTLEVMSGSFRAAWLNRKDEFPKSQQGALLKLSEVPMNVVYCDQTDHFYDATSGRRMGRAFELLWMTRKDEFPGRCVSETEDRHEHADGPVPADVFYSATDETFRNGTGGLMSAYFRLKWYPRRNEFPLYITKVAVVVAEAPNPYEPIKVIEAWDLNYVLGSAIELILCAEMSDDPLDDLQKARWFLDHEIANREKGKS